MEQHPPPRSCTTPRQQVLESFEEERRMHEHCIVRTANGLYVRVCTDTQEPMSPKRSGGVETMVFRCNENGVVRGSGYQRPVDEAWCRTEEEGAVQHQKMIDKWMKGVLV